ncbi:hypothetical protein INT43_004101 [Umbelopsis isabellina]|uniref:Uncharacterized protein n=1 Tax=Mortierella isabellina TaxID=91625 RepID=A0A8H7U7Y4_MORIS|nr:hypothetical protein INT43_004101 [Umbelopsis isabellina]
MSQENASIDLSALANQLAQQSQMIQQLLFKALTTLSQLFKTKPSQELYDRVGSLSSPIFKQTLSDEERRSIIERYPAVQGLKYSPPSAVPEAQRRFSKGQAREDSTLRNLQYSASAILRPLDAFCHELLQASANEESDRLFAIINDVRTLILHHCGAINNARVNLALRAMQAFVDPSRFFTGTSFKGVEGVLNRPSTDQLPIKHVDLPISQPTTIVTITAASVPTATAPATNTITTTVGSRRSPSAFFPRLGSLNGQQMDPLRHSRRFQNTYQPASSPVFKADTYGSLQQRTTPTTPSGNCKPPSQTGNRAGSGIGISKLLQPNDRHSQKERRVLTGLQYTTTEPIRPMSTLQNGKHTTGHQTHQEKRLFYLSGSHKCFPSYPHTPPIPALPSLPMGRHYFSISNNTVRPFSGSLAVYPHNQTDFTMGPPTGHTHIGVPG